MIKAIRTLLPFYFTLAIALLYSNKTNGQIIDNLLNGANGMVRGFFIDSTNNELYVGGQFTTISGVNCNQIARLSNGSWQALGSNEGFKNPGIIYAITRYNNELYIGGSFDSIGNQAIQNIARFDGSSWHQVGQGLNDIVSVLKVYNDTLYAGGEFDTSGTSLVGALAKYDNTNWLYPGLRFNGSVFSLITFNGDLLIGGNFQTTAGNSIINYNSNGYFGDYASLGNFVINLNVISDTLYACGSYTLPVQYLSSFYNNAWNQYPVPSGGQNWVTSIIDFNDERYVSGYFTYDVAMYTSTGFDPILNVPGYVSDLFIFQNKMYMIGWYIDSNLGLNNICALTDTSVGVKPISDIPISIYPNPTHNELNITLPSDIQYPINCAVRNVYGEELKNFKINNRFNNLTLDLPAGMYFLLLENNEIQLSYSVIRL